MRPRPRSILLRSFSRPVAMVLAKRFSASSMGSRETMSDRFLFLAAAAGAAQNVGLLTLRNRHLFHFGRSRCAGDSPDEDGSKVCTSKQVFLRRLDWRIRRKHTSPTFLTEYIWGRVT